ncbi:hypothetical protein ACEN8I_11625 [Polaromonas sp. CT11-55]|uniref:hypothetical protein n=1 Tax=Polaromonas sp. CT11-55 TaxID=3243045 RepID=UPI0039A5230C
MTMVKTVSAAALAAFLAAGCAVGVQPGMSREQVLASYGTPTRTVALASGTRLQYSRQPSGQTAVMVDLDATGKVVSARQVLNPQDFSRIEVGKWTRADVEREFGPPAKVDGVASWSGDIMTYRWRDGVQDMFFFVYLDAGYVVQRVGQGMEFPVRVNDRL